MLQSWITGRGGPDKLQMRETADPQPAGDELRIRVRATGRLGMFGISTATDSHLPGPLKLVGMAAGLPWFNPIPLMNRNRAVLGVNLGHLWGENDKLRGWMEALLAGAVDGWVRPHVDKTFPLAQAGEAQAYIEARHNIGKVVLTV